MKHLIICMDVGGYTERLRALQAAHPHVIGVTPEDKPCPGFTPIKVPDEWLSTDPTMDYPKKCWHGTGTLALAAIHQLRLDADFYWIIESDCVASTARWQAMIADHQENPTDAIFLCPRSKIETLANHWWTHPGTPAWCDVTHLNAIYRLSRRAIAAYLAAAEECRECFGEMVIGSAVKRAGGTLGRINTKTTHMNTQTMKVDPARVILNRNLVNHPVKSNTFAP